MVCVEIYLMIKVFVLILNLKNLCSEITFQGVKTTGHLKRRQKYIKHFISEKFRKQFYFFTCILPDYVAHDITKEF